MPDPSVDLAQPLFAVDVVAVLRPIAIASGPCDCRHHGRPLDSPESVQLVFETTEPGRGDVVWRVLHACADEALAAPQGFEPRYADPESAVLPLNEGAAEEGNYCI